MGAQNDSCIDSCTTCRIMSLQDGIELPNFVVLFSPRRIELSWKLMFLVLQYTPAIDIWGIGCIFAEVLTGKPLFPGKSVVHQLDLITDLLGTPPVDVVAGVRNDKARKYLTDMRKKQPVSFSQKFPNADPLALRLLKRLLAFDPKDRPTAEEALTDPYFKGLSKVEREPACQPISKLEFEFERGKVTKDDVKELIYREILEYHPQLLKDYMNGNEGMNFIYPSAIGQFKQQFAHLEENAGSGGGGGSSVGGSGVVISGSGGGGGNGDGGGSGYTKYHPKYTPY